MRLHFWIKIQQIKRLLFFCSIQNANSQCRNLIWRSTTRKASIFSTLPGTRVSSKICGKFDAIVLKMRRATLQSLTGITLTDVSLIIIFFAKTFMIPFNERKNNPVPINSYYVTLLLNFRSLSLLLLHCVIPVFLFSRVNLFEDSSGGIHLRNLSVHSVSSYEEALPLFLTGDTNRMMAEVCLRNFIAYCKCTQTLTTFCSLVSVFFTPGFSFCISRSLVLFLQTVMNKVSTRSHCIFTIHITSRQCGSATVRRAKLHLVDLAGCAAGLRLLCVLSSSFPSFLQIRAAFKDRHERAALDGSQVHQQVPASSGAGQCLVCSLGLAF